MIICLGIESTAHTFAVGIIDEKGNILADVRDMYKTEKGGLIPAEVAKHHEKISKDLIKKALEQANLKPEQINIISYSRGPGLGKAILNIGFKTANELAEQNQLPLIGINHIISHLEIGKLLCKVKDPIYVFVSGANTQIIALEGNKYRIFGETLDLPLGNALDKFGREIGLGFPAGPIIEELAKKGKYVELPYVVKGMDLSFSGIITKSVNLFKKGISKEDLCFSLQETCFAMLCEVTERALAHCEKNEVLLIGGVAANKRLCEMLSIMCNERNAKFHVVPLQYSGDNAVMIAWQGIQEFKTKYEKPEIRPYERVDQIEVLW